LENDTRVRAERKGGGESAATCPKRKFE